MKTAVVGCGAISDIYLKNMIYQFDNLEVISCCAGHYENAVKKAEQYHIRACTFDEILADGSIEMVVILTPVPTHYDLIRRALLVLPCGNNNEFSTCLLRQCCVVISQRCHLAGKHVYTEKTITVNKEEAAELLILAEEKGLYLGAVPDAFLGVSLQLARKAIKEQKLGEVTSFQICGNRNLDFLGSIFALLRMPGGGSCQDYGVFYPVVSITRQCSLLPKKI